MGEAESFLPYILFFLPPSSEITPLNLAAKTPVERRKWIGVLIAPTPRILCTNIKYDEVRVMTHRIT